MRLIGLAERALELMCKRALKRVAFGKPVADQGVTRERIANARMLIDQARLLTLNAAWKMDTAGNKVAKQEIAMIKVVAPNMACQVIDWAMQVHGGGGVCDDFLPGRTPTPSSRTLRFADGPDEVHRNSPMTSLGTPADAVGDQAGHRLVAAGGRLGGVGQHQEGGAVVDAGGIAGGDGAVLVEGRLHLGQAFHGGAGLDVLVGVEHDVALARLQVIGTICSLK
jgi:hypothetical protein